MKNNIAYVVMVCMAIALTNLSAGAFPQTDQTSNADTNAYVTGITAGRARALVGGVFGLASLIVGLRAKRSGRLWGIIALMLGIMAVILSVIHLANLTGGFGTGGGKAGAIVALVLGLIGCILSGRALRLKKQH